VLNRPPPKLKIRKGTTKYFIEVESKTLWELLKKPVDKRTTSLAPSRAE
jgi:hypothetical protein